jgi:hypothetical protein
LAVSTSGMALLFTDIKFRVRREVLRSHIFAQAFLSDLRVFCLIRTEEIWRGLFGKSGGLSNFKFMSFYICSAELLIVACSFSGRFI